MLNTRKIRIYRIEHIDSGLGPFQHGKQEVINKAIYGHTGAFKDIDDIPIVKNLLKKFKGSILFGFTNKKKCNAAIIDKQKLKEFGFEVKTYVSEPLFISDDRQVLFLKEN